MRDPEPLIDRLVHLQVRRAGDRWQPVGIGGADDRAALHRAERPQADPVRQVRVQAAQLAFLEPLGSHQQVHAQAAADPADLDEQVDELRTTRQQLAELVDDDQQVRQRLQRPPVGTGCTSGLPALVVANRVEVAGGPQHSLPPLLLALERGVHPVDHRGVVDQVRHQACHVRQIRQRRERGTALEVDQHEVQRLRRMSQRQPAHQGAQQLALARAGRADDEPVRTEAALRWLLDVEDDRLAVGAVADGYPHQARARGFRPLGGDVHRVRVAAQNHLGQRYRPGEHLLAFVGEAQRRKPAGDQLCQPRLHEVGDASVHRRRDQSRHALDRQRAVVGQAQPQVGPAGLVTLPLDKKHQCDVGLRAGRLKERPQQLRAAPLRSRIESREHHNKPPGWRGGAAACAKVGAALRRQLLPAQQLLFQELREPFGLRGDQRDDADRPGRVLLDRVRQPLDPVPVAGTGPLHGDGHVVRSMQHGNLAEHRPGQRRGQLGRPEHAHHAAAAQVHQCGLVTDAARAPDQSLRRAQRLPVVVGERVEPGADLYRGDQLGVAGADPDPQEVRIAGAALPHPLIGGRDRPQPVRVGMDQRGMQPLSSGGSAGDVADAREVAAVAQPLALVALPAGVARLEAHGHGAPDGHQHEQHANDDQYRTAKTDHVGGHADAAEQRQHSSDPRRAGLCWLCLRRCRQDDLLIGQARRQESGRTVECEPTHASPWRRCRVPSRPSRTKNCAAVAAESWRWSSAGRKTPTAHMVRP